jgi:hypothetical protein
MKERIVGEEGNIDLFLLCGSSDVELGGKEEQVC